MHPDPAPTGTLDGGALGRLGAALVWLEEALLVLLFLLLLGLGLGQIILRNVWGAAPADIEVVIRALVLWIAMFGATVAARRRRHIVVDLLGHYLAPRWRHLATAVANLVTAAICLLLTLAGFKMLALELSFDPVALFGPVPRWIVQLPIPLAFALMASQFMVHAVEDLILARRATAAPDDEAMP
ncbi:MAG: hypothetical protein Tsb002_00270 [Wenzhouxiangellaceae bacterium]